jgi:hypothetical protein
MLEIASSEVRTGGNAVGTTHQDMDQIADRLSKQEPT